MSENRRFRRKNTEKPYQSAPFAFFFFFQKPMYLLKDEKRLSIFYCKNNCTNKFYVFTKKSSPIEMCQKVVNLDLRTAFWYVSEGIFNRKSIKIFGTLIFITKKSINIYSFSTNTSVFLLKKNGGKMGTLRRFCFVFSTKPLIF